MERSTEYYVDWNMDPPENSVRRRIGAVVVLVFGGAGVALLVGALPFVLPALRRYCLPYVPATTVQTERVLSQLKGRKGKVVDLGSGDGRVVSSWRQTTLF